MAWAIFAVPNEHRTELETALKDDLVSRQSQKVREAASLGGPAATTYVLLEGSPDAVQRLQALVGTNGSRLGGGDAETLYRRFKDEEEAASAGMGLFFTDG